MYFFISLLPTTLFAVLGYVVLYCANRSEGGVKLFGKGLAIWIFILALLSPLTGAYFSMAGYSPQAHFKAMHGQE